MMIGITEVDRQPPVFFSLQGVSFDASQLPDQRRLAVIYMACGRDNELPGSGFELLNGGIVH